MSKQLSPHFNEDEFRCKCGCGTISVSERLLSKLEQARIIAGIPFNITSGYRCTAHNKAVGGAPYSYHCEGKAVDITFQNGQDAFRILDALICAGFTRIGFYKRGWIHADVGESPKETIWIE